MANRNEDEKNEKIIRNLLKLPDNRRCINCNSLGPQYVCINFWTFICTNCSGIHREVTHRVKSISMAKFTSQEVSALQGGGNASAKEIYLKEWDPQRQSLPDGSNVERLRNFIKHVYVERRYTGEKSSEKPPKAKMNESEDFNDQRRMDTHQSGSRSPPYNEGSERRYNDRATPGGRSPGYDLENRQQGDYKRSPGRAEVFNDWRREDRFGNARRSDDGGTSDGGSRSLDSRSPDRQRDFDASSPPVFRPVREILGKNITPLRVIKPPKPNGIRPPDNFIQNQRTESSSSLTSSNGNPGELKIEASLIDFDDVPEPPVVASMPPPQPPQVAGGPQAVHTAQSGGDNWANFDSLADVKISHAAPNLTSLDSVISELLVPTSGSIYLPGNPGSGALATASATATNSSAFPATATNSSAFPVLVSVNTCGSSFGSIAPASAVSSSTPFLFGAPSGTSQPVVQQLIPGGSSFGTAAHVQQSQFKQHSLFPASGGQPAPLSYPLGTSCTQASNPLVVPNPQFGLRPNVVSSSGGVAESFLPNAKSSERKELPADIFASNYSSMPAPFQGWHTRPQLGMGFAHQYNMQMPVHMFPQASKSLNPFDVGTDPSPAATFPSMSSLQGALPTMVAPGGHGNPSTSLLSDASSHPAMIPPSVYMGQRLPGSVPSSMHGLMQFGHQGAAFGALNGNPQLGGLQSTNATQNTLPSIGGNPFG